MTNTRTDQTKQRKKQSVGRLFIYNLEFLKIFVDLQTAFTADTHLAEGQWLEEQLHTVK
jgi:hypothetical protein